MKARSREALMMILVAACLAMVLANAARWFLRVDLTRSRAFSISEVSGAILRTIPEQVHITYYLSDTLRSLTPSAGRIVDLLQEYAADSQGRVLVTVLDPDRAGRAESARRYGILPQQIQVVQQNEQRTTNVYSGIVIDYLDRYTSLPAVFTADGLEYSLSFAVRRVLSGRRVQIGVVVGTAGKSWQDDYQTLRDGLSRDYSLREYLPGEEIPPEVDVLLVLGGTGWSTAECAPIDSYVMAGGKVLFGVKGLQVETARTLGATAVGDAPLLGMIESYGVRVGHEMVLDVACRSYRLPQQQASGQVAWETIGVYPPWVSVQAPNVDAGSPVTARFSGLDLLWPSPLQEVTRQGVKAEPLLKSTSSAWLLKAPFTVDPYTVAQSSPPQGQFVLGYALSGTFPSAAAGGGAARSNPTRMIVVGDDDFANDLMQFSDSLYNVIFVENAVLWLSGNADLLSIKTRAAVQGKLDRVQDPAARGRLMLAAELINVVVIPALVVLFGLVRLLRRRERGAQ